MSFTHKVQTPIMLKPFFAQELPKQPTSLLIINLFCLLFFPNFSLSPFWIAICLAYYLLVKYIGHRKLANTSNSVVEMICGLYFHILTFSSFKIENLYINAEILLEVLLMNLYHAWASTSNPANHKLWCIIYFFWFFSYAKIIFLQFFIIEKNYTSYPTIPTSLPSQKKKILTPPLHLPVRFHLRLGRPT